MAAQDRTRLIGLVAFLNKNTNFSFGDDLVFFVLLPLGLTKPVVLPGVDERALANKLVENSSKET